MEQNLIPLNYDFSYAYGCLEDIPIQNKTLDTTFTPEQEKMVLMEIFNQTDGHNWRIRTHWGNHSVSHCLWYGITCDHSGRYVVSVNLIENNLSGTLPGSLWILRNLLCLCISHNNRLFGNISNILFANMTSLLRVDLAFNKLYGRIPGESLVKMKSLGKIQLCCQVGHEGLSGKIPEDIGNLTDLQVLSLGESILYGSIPKNIAKLQKLWFLELQSVKHLRGGFENLFNLSSLRYMHLSHAGLNGTLPDQFGLYFPGMIQCLLGGNNFTGGIPSTVGNMTNLTILFLADNNFCGQIPKSIGLNPSLRDADFSGNNFTSFEKGIQFKSASLEVLILANNKQFTSSLDDFLEAIKQLSKLRILNISGCHFYGGIPEKLWSQFQNLIFLDLSKNRLSNEIPSPSAVNMFFLSWLDASSNNLSGQLPQVTISSLKVLNVSNNSLLHEADEPKPLPSFMEVDYTTLTHRNASDNFTCPNLRLKYNNGLVIVDPSYYRYRLCICDIGYYGSGKTCLPCMVGAVCRNQTNLAQDMVMKTGYWPSPSYQNVTHMVECSRALGINRLENTSCNPMGTCNCWLKEGNTSKDRPLTICRKSCLCRIGSKDRFCSRCEDGYYKQGNLCYACRKKKTSVYILASLVFLTVVFLILAFTVFYKKNRFLSVVFAFLQIILLAILAMSHFIPSWLFELNVIALIVGLAGKGNTARGILNISIFYFQTLDAMISNAADVWPDEVLETQRHMSSVFNFRFSGLACDMPRLFTPLGELVSLILLPLICITAIWLYYGICYLVLRLRHLHDRQFRLRNSCLQLSIVSLNLTYFPIVKKTASVLAPCREDKGYHYLLEAPWIKCNGHLHNLLQAFGWLAVVLYVIGVPFGVFLPLLRMKVSRRDLLTPEEQKALDSWLGSIYLPYRREFRSYFEIVFLLRRMLVAFSLSFIPRASSFQVIAVCFVLLVSLCFQFRFRPFEDSYQAIALENSVEALVLLTLHFSFVNIRYAALDKEFSFAIIWIIVVVNVVLVCFIVLCIILLFGKAHLVQTPQAVPQSEEDKVPRDEENEQSVPDGHIHTPTKPLISNGPEELYGTFDE